MKINSLKMTSVSLILLLYAAVSAVEGNIVFIVVNQKAPQHEKAARLLAENITQQLEHLNQKGLVHVATDDWEDEAVWTYYPLLQKLSTTHGSNSTWCVFLDEQSQLNLQYLLPVLHTYSENEEVFLGRALWDREETIIHHFDMVNSKNPFLYPDIRAGMALTTALITKLTARWLDATTRPKIDFTIDVKYEFARFVESTGIKLTNQDTFCIEDRKEGCAVTYKPHKLCENGTLKTEEIHIAVKTCSHYHDTRLPIIKDTWQEEAVNCAFYSDREETNWQTISLGIPNTERGHCGKTLAIIRHVAELDSSIKWLAVVDDDTLISIPRLKALLSCYNPDDMVAIGERYGYMAVKRHGYDYITGGGGMVFSQALVEQLADPDNCECPTIDTPDDMFLGVCLARLSVPVTHVRGFHQGRPMDYAPELLQNDPVISFHKHWMADPRKIYSEWLHNGSIRREEEPADSLPSNSHSEL